jgi:hypothetical protein
LEVAEGAAAHGTRFARASTGHDVTAVAIDGYSPFRFLR